MNSLINRRCAEAVSVRPGDRVLDVGAGLGLSPAAFDALDALRRHPATAIWYPICWAEGVRPAAVG